MTLRALLPHLHEGADLHRLVRHFSPATTWLALDPLGLDPEGVAGLDASAIGSHPGRLGWVALEARDAPHAARLVARACAAAGRATGVLCLDAAGRRLAIAAATPDAPGITLSLDRPDPTGLAALERLPALADATPLEALARLADAVAVEPVGTRFFRRLRLVHAHFVDALPPGPGIADRHALALLQLTRVLFLYFVQSKGWLAGRPDFLARAVDDCLRRGRRLHRDLLRPLFFGTLNQPVAQRPASARRFGAVPFLNGGLFAPHPLERQWHADLPDAAWRDAFDDLFERFHFVPHEGAPDAVAPDMLGRAFESLMEPAARRRSGTFYTPAALVRRVLRDALADWLAPRLSVDAGEARRRLDDGAPDVGAALRRVTVLDPAAGSGAFLLGALDLLAAATRGADESPSQAKRRVLRDNLHGVDLNPTAVRLAELRLWLSVIADDAEPDPARVAPLPNLDAVVRQGDSLAGSHARGIPDTRRAERLRAARAAVLEATAAAKPRALAALRRAELEVARGALDAEIGAAERAITAALAAARGSSLFGERAGAPGADREIAAWRRRHREARAARQRLERDGELATFDFHTHFAHVLAAGGFDLVIGNPPWVRGEELPRNQRLALGARYRWFRPARGRGYRNAPDLSVAFVERGLELLAPDGVLAFVVPAKLLAADYAAALRHGLATSTTLCRVAPLGTDPAVRFDATVYPMTLVVRAARPPDGHRLAGRAHDDAIPQRTLVGGAPWLLLGHTMRRVVERLRSTQPSLGGELRARLGVKTGADQLFLSPEPDLEPELLRRAVRGRDVAPFAVRHGPWLRWPCDAQGAPLPTLPPRARRWAERHADALARRADYRTGPAWTLFRTAGAAAPFRVVWADLARRLEAATLVGSEGAAFMPLNSCFVMALPDATAALALSALLNSTWLRSLAAIVAAPAANDYRRFAARVVEGLPYPPSARRDATLVALAAKGAAGIDVQEALDDCVAVHLGLDRDARTALRHAATAGR